MRVFSTCKAAYTLLAILISIISSNLVYAQPAATWSRIVGNFCIQGIPITARTVEQVEINNGVTVEQFRVDFNSTHPSQTIIMRVFREPPQGVSPLTRCSDLTGNVLLEGRIRKLTIRGARETGQGVTPAYFEIGGISGSLIDVELSKVKSTLAPLYGGLLQLGADGSTAPSSLAWVRNAGKIVTTTGAAGTGALDIESWGRQLRGAHVKLPGDGRTVTTDLSAGNRNVTLRVAVDGTSTELRKGKLTSGRLRLEGDAVVLPGSSFAAFDGAADALTVGATEAGVDLRLSNLRYSAKQGKIGSLETQATGEKFAGTIAEITSPSTRADDALEFLNPLIVNHNASAEQCSFEHKAVQLVAASGCRVVVTRADATEVLAEFSTTKAQSLMAGDALIPRGDVKWTLDGRNGVDKLAGSVTSADSRFGALALTGEAVKFGTPVVVGSELTVPFSLIAGPAQGRWQFSTSTDTAVISGNLEELILKGKIGIPLNNPEAWHVDVAANDFRFGGGISGEARPHIYDGAPIFATGTRLGFRSATPIVIANASQSGKIETQVSAFAMSSLDIKLGKAAANLVLVGPIKFEGAVKLKYDLAGGRAEIVSGKLDIQNVHLRTEPGQPGDLGSVRMRDADFRVGSIAAEFEEEDDAGSFLISGVQLDVGMVEQTPGSGADQLRWSGSLAAPLTIGTIGARIVRSNAKELELEDELATNFNLHLLNPTLGQGKQLRFGGSALKINFSTISAQNVVGSLRLDDAKLAQKSDGAEFYITNLNLAIDVTGGPLKRPNGTGRLFAGGINANIDIDPVVKFGGDITRCEGGSEYRSIPLNVRFRTQDADLMLQLDDGRLKAHGSTGVSDSYVKERGQYECRKRVVRLRIVKEVRAKYKYPCPTWRKPFRMCRGWTTIVPEVRADVDRLFRIRHLRAAGVWNSMGVRIYPDGDETKFERCLKFGVFTPAVDASYYFTPKTNIPIADSIFQELIDLYSRPFTSQLVSGLSGMLGNTLMMTKNGFCI